MLAADEVVSSHDWRTFTEAGDARPMPPVAEAYDDICEAETLRQIKATLAAVEADRDSGHDIAVCTAPESVGTRRSEIPAAVPGSQREAS